jgi:hypothetical protein
VEISAGAGSSQGPHLEFELSSAKIQGAIDGYIKVCWLTASIHGSVNKQGVSLQAKVSAGEQAGTNISVVVSTAGLISVAFALKIKVQVMVGGRNVPIEADLDFSMALTPSSFDLYVAAPYDFCGKVVNTGKISVIQHFLFFSRFLFLKVIVCRCPGQGTL